MRSATSSQSHGLRIGRSKLQDAFKRFKDLADKKKHLFDEDIMALVDDEILPRP